MTLRFSHLLHGLRVVFIRHRKLWFLAALVFFILIFFFAGWTYIAYTKDLAQPARLMNSNNTGLVITDRAGETIYKAEGVKDIQPIPLSQMSPHVQHATVAVEDKDFFTHTGLSLRGIARSLYLNFLTSDSSGFGGSTITQQLVKNAMLSAEKSYRRKFQEAVLSIEVERRYTKDEILEMYLNSIYYGAGSYGIKSAAETYFDSDPADLTIAESAMLAALPQAPSALSPFGGDSERLKARMTIVLTKMQEQGYLSVEEKEEAIKAELRLTKPPEETYQTAHLNQAVHFALWIRDYLYKTYTEDEVNRLSFRVQTTLDAKLQEKTQEILKNRIERLKNQDVSNGAVVVMVPQTGEVLAMAGSRDWFDEEVGKYNAVFAQRQPGSSFKPIVYTRAFMDGKSPSDMLHDTPTDFSGYKPKNYDNKFRGEVTIRRALANSFNVPAVELLRDVGVGNAIGLARDMGISTLTDPSRYGLSLVLGGGEVQLFELTRAYGVLANEGTFVPTHPILTIRNKFDTLLYTYDPKTRKVEDNFSREGLLGQLAESFDFAQGEPFAATHVNSGSPQRVVPESAAYMTTHILADNTARAEIFGTGSALLLSRQAAAKTGTTDSYRDSWTIGYTPDIVTGVWIGNNDNTPMQRVAGSIGAAPIWHDVMEEANLGKPKKEFQRPNDIVVAQICSTTGKRACRGYCPVPPCGGECEEQYSELFVAGTAPDACPKPTPTPEVEPSVTPETESTEEPTATPHMETPEPTAVPATVVPLTAAPPTEPPPIPTVELLPTAIPTL